MENKTKWILGVVVVILVILGIYYGNRTPEMSSDEPIRIGYIGPLSGNAAVLGDDAVKSMRLAIDEVNANGGINDRQVELFVEDDQYETSQSVSAYNKLVHADGVEAIIMSTYGGVFAVAEQSADDGVLIIDPLDCDAEFSNAPETVFCVAKETEDLGNVIADYALSSGKTAPAVLHSTVDQFMPSVSDAFKTRYEAGSETSVNVGSYTPGTTDFRSHLLNFTESDVIVWLGYDEIGLAMRHARDLGIQAEFLTIPTVATSPEVQQAAGGAAEGMRFSFYAPASSATERNQAFRNEFEEAYGTAPIVPIVSDQTYDAIQILLNEVYPSVEAGSRNARTEQAIEALLAVEDYDGVTGTLTMTPGKRISGIPLSLFELRNNAPVPVVE